MGRLDYNSEGLLLLTNDGDFANHILSAKNKVPKTYEVKVTGMASEAGVAKLRSGMRLDGKVARFQSVQLLRIAQNPWYRVTLIQGRNRQIHRMFERIGLLVEKIRRVSIGRVSLQGLEPRQVRALRRDEIRQLLSEDQPLPEELRAPPVPRGRPRRRRERRPNARGASQAPSEKKAGRHTQPHTRRPRGEDPSATADHGKPAGRAADRGGAGLPPIAASGDQTDPGDHQAGPGPAAGTHALGEDDPREQGLRGIAERRRRDDETHVTEREQGQRADERRRVGRQGGQEPPVSECRRERAQHGHSSRALRSTLPAHGMGLEQVSGHAASDDDGQQERRHAPPPLEDGAVAPTRETPAEIRRIPAQRAIEICSPRKTAPSTATKT